MQFTQFFMTLFLSVALVTAVALPAEAVEDAIAKGPHKPPTHPHKHRPHGHMSKECAVCWGGCAANDDICPACDALDCGN